MSFRKLHIACMMSALCALLGFAAPAKAGLLPVSATVIADDANFRFTYGVVLTSDSRLLPGDFFTIYNFAGYVPGSAVMPAGFVMTIDSPTRTPAGTLPTETGIGQHFTFTYTGQAMSGQIGLGNFSLISIFGNTTISDFTSRTHRAIDGQPEGTITTTTVPVPRGVETPEPATLALLGFGLPVAGIALLRRRKK